jgi:hypothetical protein
MRPFRLSDGVVNASRRVCGHYAAPLNARSTVFGSRAITNSDPASGEEPSHLHGENLSK